MMNDVAFAYQPEAVGKHQGVGKKKEEPDPEEGRDGDERFVGAAIHKKKWQVVSGAKPDLPRDENTWSFLHRDGVCSGELELVLADERAAGGNASTQKLARAIELEKFA